MDAFSAKPKQHYATGGDFHSPTPYSKQAQRRRNIFSEQEVFRMLAPQLDPLAGRHDRHNREEWILSERLEILILLLATTAWSRCCVPALLSSNRNQRTITQTVPSSISSFPVRTPISNSTNTAITLKVNTSSTLPVAGMA